jgi:hypothetical protein
MFMETFIGTCPLLQVRIRAYDSAYPSIYTETDLTVYVNRNLYGPIANSVTLTIPATTNPSMWSYVISTTDQDTVSS